MKKHEEFRRPGGSALELDKASLDRLADAKVLLAGERYNAAMASALYALEIRLKVSICIRLDLLDLPMAFQIHDLEALLILSGLRNRLNAPDAAKVKDNWDSVIGVYGELNRLRYSPDFKKEEQVDRLLNWLENKESGVLTWLSTQE